MQSLETRTETGWGRTRRVARRAAVFVAGCAVLLAGIAMIVLPGPAVLVIPLGLALLSAEVPLARWLLDRLKGWIESARRHIRA